MHIAEPLLKGLSIPKCAQNSAKSCNGNRSLESAVDDEMSRSADRDRAALNVARLRFCRATAIQATAHSADGIRRGLPQRVHD
jgi:hypothetical protein